jgi:hypothetical protein
MLRALRRGVLHRFAAIFAILAVACFAAPPAALAFGHGSAAAHCLTHADQVNHGMTRTADSHEQRGHRAPAGEHKSTCCGLFFLSALAADTEQASDLALPHSAPFPAGAAHFAGRAPERLERPPIPSLSV